MDPYVTGPAYALFRDSIVDMAVAGVAYRGTPDDPNVKVGEIRSPTDVVLTSCPVDSPTDPAVQYTKANGQPVPTSSAAVTLYQKTIYMTAASGSWKVTDFRTDSGVVCES